MNKMQQYVLSNVVFGRGAYSGLTGGAAYSAATNACKELIAAGKMTKDFVATEMGRNVFFAGQSSTKQ